MVNNKKYSPRRMINILKNLMKSLRSSNRLSFYSLIIFSFMFVLSLFAEFIANDKPLLIIVDQKVFFPTLVNYSETDLGGTFKTNANYKDEFLIEILEEKNATIIWPIIRYSYDTISYDLNVPAPSPPDQNHWLGTDDHSRDVLARIIYGFRISVLFGFSVTFISSIIGVILGSIQGYYGGKFDIYFRRFTEIWGSIPLLFVIIIISSILVPSFLILMGIFLIFNWMTLISLVRAESLKVRNMEYVTSARAIGINNFKIIINHVIPNATIAAMTVFPFELAGSITLLTALDFMGFGLPPGNPSLGELLSQAISNWHAPWLIIPGFMVTSVILCLLIFISDGVRDLLDPKK